MEFGSQFVPVSSDLGLLPLVTWFFQVVTLYALLGSAVFSWLTRTHVAPEHNTSRVLTATICVVAALSYWLIQDHYREFLRVLSDLPAGPARLDATRDAYFAIGQLRYMDWAFTTPLPLIKMVMMLGVKPHRITGLLALMLVGDFFMILTGYIGQQQLAAGTEPLAGPHYLWGAVSTLGYLAVVYGLFRVWRGFEHEAQPTEQRAFRWIAGTTVTFWGVYPLGYVAAVAFPAFDLNWLHIAFAVADVVNKVGVGVVVYLAGSTLLEERVDVTSKEYAVHVG